MAPVSEQLSELIKRQYYGNYGDCNSGYYRDRYGRCFRNSNWNRWGRWVALVLIVVFFIFVFFILSCLNARRRRKRGLNPYRGTGWTATAIPFGNKNNYNNNNNSNAYQMNSNPNYNYQTTGVAGAEPVPPYSPPHNSSMNNYNQNDGYYGGQQSGVAAPENAYHPGTGGSNVYQPPAGPPPGKGTYGADGVIR